MRHELKHRISFEDYLIIKSRLKEIAGYDAHADKEGRYIVHSLYFDNLSDKALREKLDGTAFREKFRIRYYNEDTSYIRLEKKSKRYGLCEKKAEEISKEETLWICNGNIGFLKEAEGVLKRELYAKMWGQLLRPRCLVDYERTAYVYRPGNVRVTFDCNIRTGLYHDRLFDGKTVTVPAGAGTILLEIKYDAFLPEIIEKAVRVPNRRAEAFSKYAVCRKYG